MSFCTEIKTYPIRALKTFVLYLTFLTLGTASSLHGPALLDLQILVQTNFQKVAYLIPSNSIGFIVGAMTCGFLVEYVDYQPVLIISLVADALVIGTLPMHRTLLGVCVNQATSGIVTGFQEIAGNTWLLHLWGKSNVPFMQGLHLAYGMGALLAPLIVQPFQLPVQRDFLEAGSNETIIELELYKPEDVQLEYPYLITSVMQLTVAVLFAVVYFLHPDNQEHPSRMEPEVCQLNGNQTIYKTILIGLACLINFFYFGIQLCFGYLLTTYAVKSRLQLKKATGSYMTSLFWAFFTFPRCATIVIADKTGTQKLIFYHLLMLVATNIFFAVYGSHYELALWIGVILVGISLSPLFGAIFGFLEEFTRVTSKIASIITVACSFGSFVVPQIVGHYIDDYPDSFIWINVVSGFSMFFLFIAMVIVKHKMLNARSKSYYESF